MDVDTLATMKMYRHDAVLSRLAELLVKYT